MARFRRLRGRRLGKGVCQAHLDERLSGHAETPGLLVDVAQQVHREVHVHALHRAARSRRLGLVHERRQVLAVVMQGVEGDGRERA